MGLARHYSPVVIGLASFAFAFATPFAGAWGDSPGGAGSYPASRPSGPVDPSLQHGGYYDGRPGQSALDPAAGIRQEKPAQRSGPLFRGQRLKMPKLPFGRHASTSGASLRTQQTAQNAPPNNATRGQSRVAVNTPAAGRPMAQRANAPSPTGSTINVVNNRTANARQPQMTQQPMPRPMAQSPRPVASTTTLTGASPTRSSKAPAAAAPAARSKLTAVTTKQLPPASPAIAKPSGPPSPADKLVAEAHEWSTQAKTEKDFTRIIETCRRAQASKASPAVAQYAKNLTAWSFNRRGQLKAEAGQDKEAMLDFSDAVRADQKCWRAMHNRGVLLAQGGKFEIAFDDFTRTIALNPQFAKAYSNRAALFMVANNLDAALQDYNRAIELDANLAVAHRGCGRVCQLMGRMDEAVGHYDAAVQLAPTDAYAAACRADLLTDVGRYSEALAEYDRAIEVDSESSQAHSGSAWLLATCPDAEIRDPDLAIERATKAMELGGDKDAMCFDTLAAAQASAGDFSAAMETIRKAIELAPADERDAYKDRLLLYQKAKPYRIGPVEQNIHQASHSVSNSY